MAVAMGAALPLLNVAFVTLMQRRTPRQLMGRVSAAVEVVMGVPQAISLAVGSLLVVILSYRTILAIMGAVTLVAAAYIVAQLRDQIADDVRRPKPDAEPGVDPAMVPAGP
jgi:MFS family permease